MNSPESQDDSVQRIGKYKVLGALGRGSMGVVYKAQDPEIGRIVAIKVLRNSKMFEDSDDALTLERFKSEARSAGNLRHPHIITVFDVNTEGENPYIVMDFLEGRTLAQVLTTEGKLDPRRALHYLRQVASGLDHAHSKNVIHRDIKPSNILIDKTDHAFILDFGVASFGENSIKDRSILGTPSYMSPEQLARKELDYRADLYSFAVMAYELLTGLKPFSGENLPTLVNNIMNSSAAPFEAVAPELPLSLQVEMDKALSKRPDQRFASAEAMCSAFSRALGYTSAAAGTTASSSASGGRKRKFSDWKVVEAVQNFTRGPEIERVRKSTPHEFSPWRPESRSFKADSFRLANAATHSDRPGGLYAGNEDVLQVKDISNSRYKSINLLLGILCIGLSIFILYLFISPFSDKGRTEASGDIFVSDLSSFSNMQIAQQDGDLQKLKTEPVPEGVSIHEVNDQQLMGLLISPNSSESTIVQAIREARRRSMAQLVEASAHLLKNDSYVVKIETLKLLTEQGDARVAPQVVLSLDDHDPLVRRWAAKTLAQVGDRRIVGYLEARLIKDDVEEVKLDIKRAIEKITGVPYAP